MDYKPCPVNIDQIQLSDDLMNLTEAIAKQVHEIWAVGRIKDGWSYGKTRNDVLKTTPCLVPYEDLPDSEKQYDRDTAIGTIKFICALGYKITKED